ncbi:MAG: hypothetical protein EHM28_07815, partial [Spirochaetaceae bacterium]
MKIKGKRLTIAHMAPRFSAGVNYEVLLGVLNATKKYNINLICFNGSSHGDLYEYDKQSNMIFNLVSSDIIDGIICWTSTLYKDNQYVFDMEKLAERNSNIPIVCIGRAYRDFPTIEVDNHDSIVNMMDHLVNTHGFRKIAFIRGPEYHNYASARYNMYRESLERYGIPFDERLVSPCGKFNSATGTLGVRYFLNELKLKPKKDIDAIISPSDIISAAAIKELLSAGVKIPKDIAVVGYNNKADAIEINPQLTTIDPNFIQVGEQAVSAVFSMIKKMGNVPKLITIPSKIVIRESCGCLNPAYINKKSCTTQASGYKSKARGKTDIIPEDEIAQKLNEYMISRKYESIRQTWIHALLGNFKRELGGGAEHVFIEAMNDILIEAITADGDVFVWQCMITEMREMIMPYMATDELKYIAETIFHNARVLIFQRLEQRAAISNYNFTRQGELFPVITSAITSTFEINNLIQNLENELPKLGIKASYLSLYVDTRHPEEKSRLIMAYNENGKIGLEPYNCVFPSHELLPKGILKEATQFHLLIKPLFFQDLPLGFILFDIDNASIDISIYNILSSNISSALQGANLVQNIKERARELEDAYQSLKENQQKLLIAEKLASLGRFTAGIAHEMNTPMATVRAALKEISDLVEEYKTSIGNASVLPEDHLAIAADMMKRTDLAVRSVEKSVGFIRGIKNQIY